MKSYRIIALTATACIGIGIVLCVFGYALGGSMHESFGIHYGKDGDFGVGYVDSEDQKPHASELSKFKHLEMDIQIGDITIKRGDRLMLYTEQLDADDYELIQDGDTLIINSKSKHHISSFYFRIPEYHYILTVPKDTKLESLTLNSDMGDITIDQIALGRCNIYQSLGDIVISDVNYSEMDIDQKMGDVEYEGLGQGNMQIDNSMGDISVKLKDKEKFYTYELRTSMGSIETDRETADGASQSVESHPKDARYRIKAECSMGDIELEFEDDSD